MPAIPSTLQAVDNGSFIVRFFKDMRSLDSHACSRQSHDCVAVNNKGGLIYYSSVMRYLSSVDLQKLCDSLWATRKEVNTCSLPS